MPHPRRQVVGQYPPCRWQGALLPARGRAPATYGHFDSARPFPSIVRPAHTPTRTGRAAGASSGSGWGGATWETRTRSGCWRDLVRVLGWLPIKDLLSTSPRLTGWGTTLPSSWSVGPCGPVRGLMAQRLCAPFITYFDYVLLIV